MPQEVEITIEQQTSAYEDQYSQEKVELEKPAHASMLSCWTVLSKTVIGVGLLGLAAATSVCGWFLGIALLALAGISAMFTLHLINCLIVQMGKRHVSFYTVAEKYAPYCRWIVDIAIAVKSLGVGTAYFQVYGTQLATFVQHVVPGVEKKLSFDTLRALIIVLGFVLMVPICFRKSIAKTAIINIFGILGILYIVVIGCVFADSDKNVTGTSLAPTGSFLAIAAKIPIFIFTFTCHQNMFLVGEDMKDRSRRKLDTVALLAELAGCCLFVPALVAPYVTYGSAVKSNFLDSMEQDPALSGSVPILLGGLALAIAEISAYPLQLFPCRKSTMVLVTRGKELTVDLEKKLRRILTAVILAICTVISIFVKDLGVTLSIVGIVGSNTICFIMPSFLFCKVFDRSQSPGKWWASAVVCAVSTILLPVCLTAIIYMAITDRSSISVHDHADD
jgi:amino acid permease